MAAGFTRRFQYFPPLSTLTAIEGIVIVDVPPPNIPTGVSTGTVCCVGEFADQTYATAVKNGVVTAFCQPQSIFGSQDLLQLTGNFDQTIGDFGQSGGSGFVALRNKSFSSLIVAGVSLLTSTVTPSNYATRVWRLLPGCANATTGAISAQPIVPNAGFTVVAPTQFLDSSGHRFNSAGALGFTSGVAYATGVNATAAASTTSAATQTLSLDANLTANAVAAASVGDIVVVGSTVGGIGGSTGLLGSAPTLPVNAVGASPNVLQFRVTAIGAFSAGATTVTVELMDGSSFDLLSAGWAAQPWRIHRASDADSAGVAGVAAYSEQAIGYTVPTRALDATALSGATPTDLTPQTAVPNTQDATWLPSNGLIMMVQPYASGTGATTVAAGSTGQNINALTTTTLDVAASTNFATGGGVAYVQTSTGVWPMTYTGKGSGTLTGTASLYSGVVTTGGAVLTANPAPVYILGITSANPTDPAVVSGSGTPNAAMDANYNTAIQSLLQNTTPQNTVNIAFAARSSASINKSMQLFVDSASSQGIGRMACISPPLASGAATPGYGTTTITESSVLGPNGTSAGQFDQAVPAIRDQYVIYSWPGLMTQVPELVGIAVAGSDGSVVTNGVIDTQSNGWLAAILSNLNPENNPGQGAAPVPQVMAPVLGLQRGVVPLGMNDYIALKAAGICGPRIDSVLGPIFQSGVTTYYPVIPSLGLINRQRFQFFIDDTLAQTIAPMSKLPLTDALMDTIDTEIDAFLDTLLSPNNPAQQRIVGYSVDSVSGNTQAQEAVGVYVVITKVQMVPTADVIVLQDEVGPSVITSSVTFPG